MSPILRKELQSLLELWVKNGCYLQEFITLATNNNYEIKNLSIAFGRSDLITFQLVPKGLSIPIENISVYKG